MSESHCPAVLAIELAAPLGARVVELPTEEGASLVDAVAHDLARLLPGVEQLGLALSAALYDPAQVLRPGWPLFAELALLYRRERRGAREPAVIGFGTAGGRMASPLLEPEPGLGAGAFVVAPFVLIGQDRLLEPIGARMETVFNEQGLAGAAVALFLAQAVGLEVAHARYMTAHDLCALTSIQLDHVGLGEAWLLLEAALLDPQREVAVEATGGWPWRYAAGAVTTPALGFRAWCAGAGAAVEPAARALAYLDALGAERRMQALLTAHGLPPSFDVRGAERIGPAAFEPLGAPQPGHPRVLVGRTAPGLGLVAVAVAERGSDGWQAIGHAYPLAAEALPALLAALAARYGTAADLAWRVPFAPLGDVAPLAPP